MHVREVVEATGDRLSPAERRVADVVLAQPQVVAFGTVAEVAIAAATSGATVVRFAAKLGFDGFPALQGAVQEELTRRLRPATERIRQRLPRDLLGRATAVEIDNVHDTLAAVDRDAFAAAVALLADRDRSIAVLSGDATDGVAHLLGDGLASLRDGIVMLDGGEARVMRTLAQLAAGDVVVALDLRRYERWLLRTVERAVANDLTLVAITDSPLSPLAAAAAAVFTVAAEGIGPFDSHVGTLALVNVLLAAVAGRLRHRAAARLDRVERAWVESGALVDR